MISRLSASAAFFAVLATASLAYAADVRQHAHATTIAAKASAPEVIMLPGVEVIGRRAPP